MFKLNKHLFLLSILLVHFSCEKEIEDSSNEQNNQMQVQVYKTNLLNRQISLIDTLETINRGDLISRNKPLKLVSQYIASCSPCLIKMKRWKKLIEQDSTFSNVEMIFYAKNSLTWYFKHQVKEVNDFPFTIYHDPADIFSRANNSPELTYVNSVLLDQNSRVIFAGNPMENESEFNQLSNTIDSYNQN